MVVPYPTLWKERERKSEVKARRKWGERGLEIRMGPKFKRRYRFDACVRTCEATTAVAESLEAVH